MIQNCDRVRDLRTIQLHEWSFDVVQCVENAIDMRLKMSSLEKKL